MLGFVEANVPAKRYEYAVLVTDLNHALLTIAQLAVALVYNWWSLFVRLGNPKAHLEAITSRPFLLSSVARHTTHSGAQLLTITPQHAEADKAKFFLATAIHELINRFKSAAEQLKTKSIWQPSVSIF